MATVIDLGTSKTQLLCEQNATPGTLARTIEGKVVHNSVVLERGTIANIEDKFVTIRDWNSITGQSVEITLTAQQAKHLAGLLELFRLQQD